MTYSSFAVDVLIHGAHFACSHADRCGVPGDRLAKWLSRLTLKASARPIPTVGSAA